jgi:bifunctional non-homologous end joining protein LigD
MWAHFADVELSPMLARSAPAVPVGDVWVFEPKMDGFRTLLAVDAAGQVRITSRRGHRWERAFPELADLGRRLGRRVVLDGENVVMGDGRPDFGLLSRRLHGRPGPPATFVAFDVLELDGERATNLAWQQRRRLLEDLELDSDRAVVTMVCDDGAALYAATDTLAVEGVVAKRRTSRYLCGRRSNAWVRIKHRHQGWFGLAGWRPPGRSWPAGGLVLVDDGVPAGTAIGALSPVGREAVHQLVARHGTPGPGPVIELPAGVQVRVEYLERSATGLVREAIARELRPALPT